jgi:hypothetical protein
MCAKFTDQGILVTVDVAVFFFFLFLQPFFYRSSWKHYKKMGEEWLRRWKIMRKNRKMVKTSVFLRCWYVQTSRSCGC